MRGKARTRTLPLVLVGYLALFVISGISVSAKDKDKDTRPGRLLTGKVLDKQDNTLANAIVYVTDTRTRAVKTFIVGNDGVYRFPALASNVDYEVYAQLNGKTSDTKRVSQFDDRKIVNIILHIDTR
ncbi:MAG: carboxypeptidase regulatory-like domain-containing protein [Acidobacteria bacterium]|nr:carboxypeptidase regulatory-like domain-containing protein [Acidobacteriota bacterium]